MDSDAVSRSAVEAFLTSPYLWGFVSLLALALALSGKLDVSAAKWLLVVAWLMSAYALYKAGPILRQPFIPRILLTALIASAVGLALYYLSEWMSHKPSTANSEASPLEESAGVRPPITSTAVKSTGGELHLQVGTIQGFDKAFDVSGAGKVDSNVGQIIGPSPSATQSPATVGLPTSEVAELRKDIQNLRDEIIKSPSFDDGVKLSALQNRASDLAKQQDTFTNREKEILREDSLSLKTLEEARKQHLGRVEAERQQEQLAKQTKEIESKNSFRAAEEQHELKERNFANQFTPIVEYAITSLHRQLDDISKQSSEPLVTNFPGDRPSIYGSEMLKDGKFTDSDYFIRVGSHNEWEFHVTVSGARVFGVGPGPIPIKRYLNLQIKAGTSRVIVNNTYPRMEPVPLPLNVQCLEGENKSLYSENCSFSEYQRPIDHAIRELIKDRYYESPLQEKR